MQKCHKTFFLFLTRGKGLKTFFLIQLIFQSNLGLKSAIKKEKSHMEGGGMCQKSAKNCHILFEWTIVPIWLMEIGQRAALTC